MAIRNEYMSSQENSENQLSDFQQKKVVENLNLVKVVVRRIADRLPSHIDSEDLVHCGILGLIDAAQRFSWGREREKEEFCAYATVRIRGQIMDELRHHDILPRSARDKVNKFKKAVEVLIKQYNRQPTDQEICEYLEIDLEACYQLKAEANYGFQVSMDAPESPAYLLQDVLLRSLDIVSPDTPEGLLHVEEVKSILTDEISRLNHREQQVISLYYLEELTLKEIGLALEITESRVSQIHSQAISKLMKRLGSSFDLETLVSDTGG